MNLQKIINSKQQKDAAQKEEQQKQQDPFSKAVMHIISKEYYKETQISNILQELVELCVREWDELLKLHQIISDKDDVNKVIAQIANTLCSDMQVKSIQRTSPIFFYGDKDDQIYYVLKGQVQLFIPKSQKEIWDEIDFNKRLKNSSNDRQILEEKDRFDIVVNAIQKMKGSHIDLIKQNEKLRKKYFDEDYQVSRIKKVHQVKVKQLFGELSYLLEKPRPYTAVVSEELYCVIFQPKTYRKALGEYYSFINSKNIYLNNYFSSNIRKETIFHLSVLFSQEIKLHLGDYLFKEGEQGNRIYLLKQGKIEFQRRLASSILLQKKKAQFKKIQQTGKDYDNYNKNSDYFSTQSLAKLTQGDEIENDQEGAQNIKRSNKKKKTVQIASQTLDQEDSQQSNGNDQYVTSSSFKIKSMAGFDDIEKSDVNRKQTQNSSNNNFDEVKYKDVSLGLIQQGEFFGFEDILISSSNNYSQNISQNRRTYSAKIISSEAIVLCIERSAFLKILSQNQVLDQDIKTKALVKILYHQQRIDSLKKFEDSKHIPFQQKVPLKEMLKDRYLSMDLRPNHQKTQQTSISNMTKQREQNIKINMDNVANSERFSTSTPQSTSFNQSPLQSQSQLFSRNESEGLNIQKNQSLIQKSDSIKIKQEKKLIDDIDNIDELNIPKDISKGNIQFLRFHNGQFTDLKSMKQSYIDSEERYKLVKKTKHSVNISDEHQLALERLYQKTNSPSIKNFKDLILKKNSSIGKSAFNKYTNNNNQQPEEPKKKDDEGEESGKNQGDDDNSSSPSHKKLKLILTKNKSLKETEQQPYNQQNSLSKNTSYSFNKMLNSSQLKRDQSKEKDQSHSFIKLQQIESEKDSDKIENQNNNEPIHKESEYIMNMSLSQDKKYSNKIQSCENDCIFIKVGSEEASTLPIDSKSQKLSINILSENEADSITNIQRNDKNVMESETLTLSNDNQQSPDSNRSNGQSQQIQFKYDGIQQNQQFKNPNLQTHQQKLNDLLTPTNISRKQEISNESYLGFNLQVNINSQQEKQLLENQIQSDNLLSVKKQPNRMLKRFKDGNYELPKILLSPSDNQLNESHDIKDASQEDRSQRMQNKYQQSLTDLGQDLSSYRDIQLKSLTDQLNQNDINPRSKSLNYLEDPSKIGTFSSFLPSLINFDNVSEQQNVSSIIEKKQIKGELKAGHQKSYNRMRNNQDKNKQEIQSQQSIYFNQYLQSYNNAQKIIDDLKVHLNDKTNSSDVSTYINMRNHSLPSLTSLTKKPLNSGSKKSSVLLFDFDSKYSSPLRNNKIELGQNSKYTSPSLQQAKAHHFKLRHFELNFDGSSLSSNVTPRLDINHLDGKQMFNSKITKRSDDYFKNLFSNPRAKLSLV